jgi:hypothetical protein
MYSSYGTGSNAHYLQQYGFAIRNNTADTLAISANHPQCKFVSFFPAHARISQDDLEQLAPESLGADGYVLQQCWYSIDQGCGWLVD